MDIGTFIHNRRLELGLTLEEVGNAVGVKKATVTRWEKGIIRNMRRDKIMALAAVLQVSPETFIDTSYLESGDPLPPSDPDESDLLAAYRALNPEGKKAVRDFVRMVSGNPAMLK